MTRTPPPTKTEIAASFLAIFVALCVTAGVRPVAIFLVMLLALGTPFWFYAGMGYIFSRQKPVPALTPEQAQLRARQKAEEKRRSRVACAVALVVGGYVFLRVEFGPPRVPRPDGNRFTTAASEPPAAPALPARTPAPQAGDPTLNLWYEQLLAERRELDLKDRTAVRAFNAHVHEYDAALRGPVAAGVRTPGEGK